MKYPRTAQQKAQRKVYDQKRGRPNRPSQATSETAPFIAWDGEGARPTIGCENIQLYILFGASTGDRVKSHEQLGWQEILELICDVGARHPKHKHIAFAFDYDVNMIVRTMGRDAISKLYTDGHVNRRSSIPGVSGYRIMYRPGKSFGVTRYSKDGTKVSVTIEDIFTFFGTSFIKVYEDLIGPLSDNIVQGKAGRNDFTIADLSEIETYWDEEVRCMARLAERFREILYMEDLYIKRWYGPGALANHLLRENGIKEHMAETPPEVQEAAQHAYAGGRFELFQVGRTTETVYGVDINSAYPDAIRQLPSLANGYWRRCTGPPSSPTAFSLHKVNQPQLPISEVALNVDGAYDDYWYKPSPLWYRSPNGGVHFGWRGEGWYWAPEVWEAKDLPNVEIGDGWEFVEADPTLRPFAWINDMYTRRSELKKIGSPAQLGLKLGMNSIYGKGAQRVGWNEEKMTAPMWHQLEWSGWVTSMTRAKLHRVISSLKPGSLIALETDAIYTTDKNVTSLATLGDQLGEWGLDVYHEAIYLQSGLAWLRKDDKWTAKRRGLDKGSFTIDDAYSYLQSAIAPWGPYEGMSTRFVKMGQALQLPTPLFDLVHCTWIKKPKQINVGWEGKRRHAEYRCPVCIADEARGTKTSLFEKMHPLYIALNDEPLIFGLSSKHPLPWKTGVAAAELEEEW